MRNELYHHGIEGQRWGVRNGPPYPIQKQKKSTIKIAKPTLADRRWDLETKIVASVSDKVRVGLTYIKKILLYNNQNIVNNVIAQDNLQKAAEEMKRRGVYTMHISELYK